MAEDETDQFPPPDRDSAVGPQAASAPGSGGKPLCRRVDALAVLTRLRDAGHSAFFAGGCVRDLLLGHEPKDWDVATDAQPNRVRGMFPNTQAVGAAFGVILVRHHGSSVEVATFRADAQYADGRHPDSVRFTTAEEDAKRRDFTMNGLFLDPLRSGSLDEQVIDYVGGRADLRAGRIRAIGDPAARFGEDHLRMLRAVRFAGRFGFEIETATAAAIRRHSAHLVRISPERIADELRIMLTPPTRAAVYRLLEELGLRQSIFRFLEIPRGPGRIESSRSVFAALASDAAIPFSLAIAGASIDEYLWHGPPNADPRRFFERPVGQKIVRAVRQSLKISNDESGDILGALEGLDPLVGADAPRVATMKRFLARPTADMSRRLLKAVQSIGLLDTREIRSVQERLSALEKTQFAPPPLITGDDLAKAGLTPGPQFKRILDAVYDAQLEDRIVTHPAAMEMALSMFQSKAS
ncbi:MAG TPA: CCA tRNA nucleotidyltransferase [Tepidisphaeraceae bacterium]|jgi:poly(A) polymerase|nr:CCA tRNA nucleotidyltransferase [Tepidisphaeraceae bacterium]